MSKLLVLHGPNLNLLGTREPSVYGTTTLAEIDQRLQEIASAAGIALEAFQSNSEGALVDRVQAAKPAGVSMIVINPGAYTHTSIALRDAFAAVAIPFIEIHLSNVHAREEFRRKSYLSDVAIGVITGLGADGYQFAVEAAIRRIKRSAQTTQNHQ
jgi:3-dehydroquinate dehydratase-2